MWSSKSVILISIVATSVTVIVTLLVRQKIQLYIEKSAKKIASRNNNQNEHFSSAFQSIGGSKDVQSVIPQTSNKVVRKHTVVEEDDYVAPPGSGKRWTRL